ncbi:hypothetical protein HY004_00895 [Candidatus Saccharibacteria bacterium]|nr:hypothetical protein [Candidatus Saccharibacteria bacterium]
MSDIDFDELDKAVNSLVGDDKVDEKNIPPVETPRPMQETPKPASVPPPTNLPSKRAGRFMDMKHDSSDMTKDSPSLMTSNKTSIKPLSSDIKPDEPADKPSETATSKSDWPDPIEKSKDEVEAKEDPKPSTDMPDPLGGFNPQKDDDKKKPADNDKKDSEDPDTKEPKNDEKKDDEQNKDEESKKTSPFLDDAKVEKRPLGGLDNEDKSDDEPEKKEGDKESKDKDSEEKTPEAPPEPIELPPELDKDLVAIEADEAPEPSTPATTAEPELQKESDKEDSKKEEDSSEDDSKDSDNDISQRNHKEEVSQLLATAASGSIPDQYKRENRSHELHAAHPLFDDEGFKKSPVAAPKKPKSGVAKIFQWIFISLGIVLLGGSIGAAVFVLLGQS